MILRVLKRLWWVGPLTIISAASRWPVQRTPPPSTLSTREGTFSRTSGSCPGNTRFVVAIPSACRALSTSAHFMPAAIQSMNQQATKPLAGVRDQIGANREFFAESSSWSCNTCELTPLPTKTKQLARSFPVGFHHKWELSSRRFFGRSSIAATRKPGPASDSSFVQAIVPQRSQPPADNSPG